MAFWATESGDNYQSAQYRIENERLVRSDCGETVFAVISPLIILSSKASSNMAFTKSSSRACPPFSSRFISSRYCNKFGHMTLFYFSSISKVGFPCSVRPEYLEYQCWDTIQALSSYLRGIFTTRAILAGVGVSSIQLCLFPLFVFVCVLSFFHQVFTV